MLIPARIPIGGHFYSVILKHGLESGTRGLTDRETRTIYLDIDHPEWVVVDSLLHEIKHAQQEEFGLTQWMNDREEENDAQQFASFLTSLFVLEFRQEWLMLGAIDTEDAFGETEDQASDN